MTLELGMLPDAFPKIWAQSNYVEEPPFLRGIRPWNGNEVDKVNGKPEQGKDYPTWKL